MTIPLSLPFRAHRRLPPSAAAHGHYRDPRRKGRARGEKHDIARRFSRQHCQFTYEPLPATEQEGAACD